MRNRKLAGLAALVLSTFAIGAFAQNQKPAASDTELNYQAGSSPMGDVPMYQSMNPKAPKMTRPSLIAPVRSTLSAAPVATACCAKAPPASR